MLDCGIGSGVDTTTGTLRRHVGAARWVESTSEDKGRGFVKGSIRLPGIAYGRSNEPTLARRLLWLRDFELCSIAAEAVGL